MSSIALPYHHEDMVVFINQAFGKNPAVTDEQQVAIAKSQIGIIVSEYNEISEAIELKDTDKLRDALADLKVTLFGYPFLVTGKKITDRVVTGLSEKFAVDQNTTLLDIAAMSALNPRVHTETKRGERRRLIQDLQTEDDWDSFQITIDRSLASEMAALQRNSRKGKYEEAVNAVINLVMTCYRIEVSFGIPTDSDFEEVCRKLLTRLCSSEEVAISTVKKYSDEYGIETYITGSPFIPGMFAVRSLEDQVGTDGENYPAEKFLKSIEFGEPVFKTLPMQTIFQQAAEEHFEEDVQGELFDNDLNNELAGEEETRG